MKTALTKPKEFVNVTEASGIYSSPLGYGLAVRVADINSDGWPDLYVRNDFHENDFIYLNQKNKTFKEAVGETINHSSRFTGCRHCRYQQRWPAGHFFH